MTTATTITESSTSKIGVPTDVEGLRFDKSKSFSGSRGGLVVERYVSLEVVLRVARELRATCTVGGTEYFVATFITGPHGGTSGQYTEEGFTFALMQMRPEISTGQDGLSFAIGDYSEASGRLIIHDYVDPEIVLQIAREFEAFFTEHGIDYYVVELAVGPRKGTRSNFNDKALTALLEELQVAA